MITLQYNHRIFSLFCTEQSHSIWSQSLVVTVAYIMINIKYGRLILVETIGMNYPHFIEVLDYQNSSSKHMSYSNRINSTINLVIGDRSDTVVYVFLHCSGSPGSSRLPTGDSTGDTACLRKAESGYNDYLFITALFLLTKHGHYTQVCLYCISSHIGRTRI